MIAADGTAVYPWNHGETLTAAALNAAIAQQGVTAGGTVTGPLIVTATNGTTPHSVQDRFGEVVDIHDFGQIGTGNAAIDTATMLAAVAALPANGGLLWIGGTNTQGITLNQTITINKSCKILGSTVNGWCSSIVCLMNGPAILFSDPTPTYQKTFEVENVRFVGNNGAQATQSAIQVNIGPTSSQVFPSFVGRNIVIAPNTASAASPYPQTFTRGIEFVPASVSGAGGIHNFWNVVLENVMFMGANDSGTSAPIAGTAGIAFGQLIYGSFRNVHVSLAASGFHQTDYCEGITCLSCQIYTVANGWDQGSFAPVGASNVKLLQPVLIGSMITATQSAINLDCVYIGVFQGNYLTGPGAANVLLSNAQSTQVCNNYLNTGTIGISLTKGSYNEGYNLLQGNIIGNATTHVSLGSGTYGDCVFDNSTGTNSAIVVTDNGTANQVRSQTIAAVGNSVSTDTELRLVGASGAWRNLEVFTGGTASSNQRWAIGSTATAESGSNVGSDFQINAYSDTGTNLGGYLVIPRATGVVQMYNGMQVGGGPTIRAGTGAASGTQPAGSLWLRTDGAVGSRLYVSAGGGTWNAVAGV